MPPVQRWGPPQERDLAIAIIISQSGDRPKYNWEKVTEIMSQWGHTFTRDAINQHWSKRIMKEFKERHGEAATAGSGPSTPKGAKAKTPASSKRKKSAIKEEQTMEDQDDDPVDFTPSKKKRKGNKAEEVKPEPVETQVAVAQDSEEQMEEYDAYSTSQAWLNVAP